MRSLRRPETHQGRALPGLHEEGHMKTLPTTAVLLAGAYLAVLLCSHHIRHMEGDDWTCRPRTAADPWPDRHSPDGGYTTCAPRAWYLP